MEIKRPIAREGIGHNGSLEFGVALGAEVHSGCINHADKRTAGPFQRFAGRQSDQPVLRGPVVNTRGVLGEIESNSAEEKF